MPREGTERSKRYSDTSINPIVLYGVVLPLLFVEWILSFLFGRP